MNTNNNTFPASDWFDLNFFGGYINSSESLKIKLNDQYLKVDNSRLSSRILNHWYELGVITDDRPNGKGWKKFSLSELVWVHIVFKLRTFGLDLRRIKIVKDQIDVYNYLDNISNCPLLDFYITVALYSKIPVKLIVFESGQTEIVRQIDIDLANQIGGISEDFISIDINKLLNRLLTKKNLKVDYLSYSDLPKSKLNEEIEDSLSKEDINSITIKVKDENYIINEKFFMKNKTKANALMSLLKFGELLEKKSSGKSTYELTNKKKIKRDNP
tara:strand:- start:26 stop:841 length:816 start_codon:yes stop_codon:yes gene_type:complete